MQKLITISLLAIGFAWGQEPSAFNAGGSVPQKSESQIINEKLFNLSNKIQIIEESQEGLKSIFEGQIQRIQNLSSKIDLVQGENNATSTEIKKHVDSNFALQNENIDKLKNSISALGALIQKTNTQMQNELNDLKEQIAILNTKNITKTESKTNNTIQKDSKGTDAKINAVIANLESNSTQLESLNPKTIDSPKKTPINESNESKTDDLPKQKSDTQDASQQDKLQLEQSQKQNIAKPKEELKNKKLSEVFKEGEEFYKNKNYDLADEYLQFAVKGNYKPARGNYLLGQVAFEQQRYEDAIYYYKTSATRYDKADYMPRLMLNSAKSFSAIKEKENAKRFLESLISLYPKSSEAKEAKKLLK